MRGFEYNVENANYAIKNLNVSLALTRGRYYKY